MTGEMENLSVLLVDSGSENLERMKNHLREIDGYNVSINHVRNRDQAFEAIDRSDPDLILLEHELGDESGFPLARRVRDDHYGIPIIVLTDNGDEKICAKYFRIGVDDYRVKEHLDQDELQTSVQFALSRRRNKLERKRAAKFDELTKLYNRRFTFKRIHEEMTSAVRHDHPFSLCLIDLDKFKDVNDRLGHLAGDFLLKRVSHLIKESIRTDDIAGRYGGDEFLLGFRNTNCSGAFRAAKKLSQKIGESVFNLPVSEQTRINCCIGVAEFDGKNYSHDDEIESVENFIDRADQALYHAKRDQPGTVERRRHERHQVEDPVPVTLQYESNSRSAHLVNLSREGARLKEGPLIQEGKEVTLLFNTRNGHRMEKKGIIRSCHKHENSSKAMIGVEVDIPRELMEEHKSGSVQQPS